MGKQRKKPKAKKQASEKPTAKKRQKRTAEYWKRIIALGGENGHELARGSIGGMIITGCGGMNPKKGK
jgi:hypothetical protein